MNLKAARRDNVLFTERSFSLNLGEEVRLLLTATIADVYKTFREERDWNAVVTLYIHP